MTLWTLLPKSKIILQTYTLICTYQTALQLSKHRPKNQLPQIHNLSCVGQHATENLQNIMDNNCLFENIMFFFLLHLLQWVGILEGIDLNNLIANRVIIIIT